MKRKIFFDLDGPILDVRQRYYSVYAHCLNLLGGTPLSIIEYWNLKKEKISETDIINRVIEKKDIDYYLSQRKRLIEDPEFLVLDTVWTDLSTAFDHYFRKFPAVLVTLRSNPHNLKSQLEQLHINSWFFPVLSHPNSEPSENHWQIKVDLIKQSDLLKNQSTDGCVFIGDTETDIRAGQVLGMKTIAVSFGIRTRDVLLKYNPDQVCDSPAELGNILKII